MYAEATSLCNRVVSRASNLAASIRSLLLLDKQILKKRRAYADLPNVGLLPVQRRVELLESCLETQMRRTTLLGAQFCSAQRCCLL